MTQQVEFVEEEDDGRFCEPTRVDDCFEERNLLVDERLIRRDCIDMDAYTRGTMRPRLTDPSVLK